MCPLKVCATRIIWFVAISSCMCSICLADGTHTHTVVVVVSLEWTRNRYRNGLLLLWLFVESQMSNIKWSEKDKRAHFSNSHCTISSTCMCIYCLSVFRLCSPSAFGVIYLVPLTVAASPLNFSIFRSNYSLRLESAPNRCGSFVHDRWKWDSTLKMFLS